MKKVSQKKPVIPARLLRSRHRQAMWKEAFAMLKRVEKAIPVSHAYVMGSFVSKKSRPADVDFIILAQTKGKNTKDAWSLDLVIAPDNEYGEIVKEDAKAWMKEKYGAGADVIQIK